MNVCEAAVGLDCGDTLFPTDLPRRDWVHFSAQGYTEPVCGVVYRLDDQVTNGMALGGIDTGCIDLETSGFLGYSTIFNSHVPRRGPINLPILGINIGEDTWVLCDKQPKEGSGGHQIPVEPILKDIDLAGVKTAEEIHYWGHYPVADLEFETSAPVGVGLRAWAPFFPGDVKDSMIPAIMFEVHLRNTSGEAQEGTLAFSFPGPTPLEAGTDTFTRRELKGKFNGVEISAGRASYAVGVVGKEEARCGGGLRADGAAWARIGESLPDAATNDPDASGSVTFSLKPGESKVVRFVVSWYAPTWNSIGVHASDETVPGISKKAPGGEPRIFHHMYARFFPSAAETAQLLADGHEEYLKRILAWQEAIYAEKSLPVWLRDSLINILYLITEDGMWAQKKDPIPSWAMEEDGLFGMNECPRGCPQIECIPCSFYGSLPIVYFFPELELSTIRGYKNYQFEDGAPTWVFGGCTTRTPYIDFAYPARGYQFASNGISLAAIVDEFVMCHDTLDRKHLKEFYPMVKKAMTWTVNLRTTPSYSIGERIIAMPNPDSKETASPPTEWFEAPAPGWAGMTAHIGGLHLAQLRITERMAQDVGDTEFAKECAEWIRAGADAMEERLWTGSYYLNFLDPESDRVSDLIFGYQLDGEWITDHHGLPSALPEDRVRTVLETIWKKNVAISKYGAANYVNPDGSPAQVGGYGTYSYFPPEALMLAMTYMYHGQQAFGTELACKVWHDLICLQGYTWDMPNIMRGDVDTGERTFGNDYYQDMMLWSLPAAIAGEPLNSVTKPGGLVYRVITAAVGK